MDSSYNFLKCGVVGGLAGLIVDTLQYPVETLKTRIMASSVKENLLKSTENLSKFRGVSCQLMIAFPYSFTFFVIYQGIRDRLPQSHMTNFFAAVVSEVVANFITNPLELVKQQIMVGRSDKVVPSLKTVYSVLGLRGFYIGYAPALIRDIMFSAIELPMYEYSKQIISKRYGYDKDSPALSAVSGAGGAVIASILTTPLDVIKTRHMTINLNQPSSREVTSSAVARVIYAEEGFKGFFKGVWYRCGLFSAGALVYFYVYGYLRKTLNVKN